MGKKFNYNNVKQYIENQGYELLSETYVNTHKKLKLKCPNGHIFDMSFNNFKKGQRCKDCKPKNKYTIEQIKDIAYENGYILLNNEDKVNMRTMLKLQDKDKNITEMMLYTFEYKFINVDINIDKEKSYENVKYTQEYVEKIVSERGYRLLNKYEGNKCKLEVECPNGHIHHIRFDSFKNGSGCRQCMIYKMTNDIEYVIKNLKEHGYKLLSKYNNNSSNITLQCEKGHIFDSTYDRIVNHKSGCPICNESKGEKKVAVALKNNNIKFQRQYKFDDCKFYRALPFDFYLNDLNILIEYDGIQHYEFNNHFGGLDVFIDRKIRDTVKNIYCQNNNIKLIRIPYWEFDNIENILINELNLNNFI